MTTVVWPHRTGRHSDSTESPPMESEPISQSTPQRTLRVVLAGGGTGGHLYPGLAVADALETQVRERGNQLQLSWAATPRPVDQHLLSSFGDNYIRQTVQPLTK